MHIRIQNYEPRHREQVISLTTREYPYMLPWFENRFAALYEDPLQLNRCGMFVALTGEQVVGFISYVYWPLSGISSQETYQMVGLVVDPSTRGQGVFGKLLKALDEHVAARNAAAVFGFPVPVSRGGFLKQGWNNLFDLQWFIRPVNLFAVFRRRDFSGRGFVAGPPEALPEQPPDFIETQASADFWKYREMLSPDWPGWHFVFEKDGKKLVLIFRIQKRMGLNEACLGKVYAGDASVSLVTEAISAWIRMLGREGSVALASAAIHPECHSAVNAAVMKRFIKTGKKIHFINKTYNSDSKAASPANWNVWRADMETW